MTMKRPQLNRWLTPNELTRQGISEESARAIELKNGLPHGWLDVDPSEEIHLLDAILNEDELVKVKRVNLKMTDREPWFSADYPSTATPSPIFFRRSWIEAQGFRAEALCTLEVTGPSMEPGLFQGDLVVVNTQDRTKRDGDVYAMNYEGTLLIRRLKRDSGEWWLAADNLDKRYFPDKRCSTDCHMIGRIIQKQSSRI